MPAGSDGTIRKRAERLEVKLARQAMSAVLTIRGKIGPWQARVARMRAEQKHGRERDGGNKLRADASALLVEIEAEQKELRHRARLLSADVIADGHYQDVVRAIGSVATAAGVIAATPRAARDAAMSEVLNLVIECHGCGQPSHLTILGFTPARDQRIDCPVCGALIGNIQEIAAAAALSAA